MPSIETAALPDLVSCGEASRRDVAIADWSLLPADFPLATALAVVGFAPELTMATGKFAHRG
jgi:hypothetical protein